MAGAKEEVATAQQSRWTSNDGEKIKAGTGQMRRAELGTAIPSFQSRRPFEELLTAMRKGADMLKHGRQGKPKLHFFRLGETDSILTWRSAKGTTRSVALRSVTQIVNGQTTESFKRYPNPAFEQLSFSLLYHDKFEGGLRTLDLTVHDRQTFELWFYGLQALIEHLRPASEKEQKHRSASALQISPPVAGAVGMPFGSPEAALKSPVISAPKSLSNAEGSMKVSPPGIGGGTAQGRVTGAMGVPIPEQQLGDCYMWGTIRPKQSLFGSAKIRARNLSPLSIKDTTHLDVMEVAAGLNHASLLTRGGEMYTWGDGSGGKLGLGHQEDAESPQRLHTLWGQPVRHIAVSDSCTAAITVEGQLWTWGELLASASGYAGVQRQCIPRPVTGPLSEQVVVQVSCGPFHSAAVTSAGDLFTWGNGLCGKLGHGDQLSCLQPRQVLSLADKLVTQASCGAWHTAAIASPRPAGPNVLEGLPFIERLTVQHKLAAMYELTEEDDGALYTWGCVFSSGGGAEKADHHKGCLGSGDKLGRLLPALVEGPLEGLGLTSVAAGLSFTAAVTSDGRVWQMGETGAPSKGAAWEGALVPCQVGGALERHFVQSVSAGRHHVAALGGPVNAATGKAHEGAEGTVILTWGRGQDGQLGTGAAADSATPQVVEELRGRRALQVVCGGSQTMAVCLYDPKSDDTEERRKGYKAKMKQWFSNSNRGGAPETPQGFKEASTAVVAASTISSKPQPLKEAKPSGGLKKTLSGSGLVPPIEIKQTRKGGRRKGSTASELAHPKSGLSTPTYGGGLRSSLEGFASEATITPRDEDAEAPKAVSEANSKQSSLTSTDLMGLESAMRQSNADAKEPEDREAYIKGLEAKLEHLQGLLKQQQAPPNLNASMRMGATSSRGRPPEARPSVVDVSPTAAATPRASVAGAMTMRRVPQAGQDSTLSRTSRAPALPNARQSALFKSIEDVHAPPPIADADDRTKESAELSRLRRLLTSQLALIDRRQAALSSAGAASEEPAAVRMSETSDRAIERMFGAGPASTSKRPSSALDSTAKRKDGPHGVRIRSGHHRRSRSGSGSSAFKSPVVGSPFSATQSRASPAPSEAPSAKPSEPAAEEVAPGVFLTIEPDRNGFNKLTRIRFARQRFSREAADVWWHEHKHELARRFNLRASKTVGSSASRQPSAASTQFATPLSTLSPTAGLGASPSVFSTRLTDSSTEMEMNTSNPLLGSLATGDPSRFMSGLSDLYPHPRGVMDSAKTEEGWPRDSADVAVLSLGLEEFRSTRLRADALRELESSNPMETTGFHTIREHAISIHSDAVSSSPEESPGARALAGPRSSRLSPLSARPLSPGLARSAQGAQMPSPAGRREGSQPKGRGRLEPLEIPVSPRDPGILTSIDFLPRNTPMQLRGAAVEQPPARRSALPSPASSFRSARSSESGETESSGRALMASRELPSRSPIPIASSVAKISVADRKSTRQS